MAPSSSLWAHGSTLRALHSAFEIILPFYEPQHVFSVKQFYQQCFLFVDFGESVSLLLFRLFSVSFSTDGSISSDITFTKNVSLPCISKGYTPLERKPFQSSFLGNPISLFSSAPLKWLRGSMNHMSNLFKDPSE